MCQKKAGFEQFIRRRQQLFALEAFNVSFLTHRALQGLAIRYVWLAEPGSPGRVAGREVVRVGRRRFPFRSYQEAKAGAFELVPDRVIRCCVVLTDLCGVWIALNFVGILAWAWFKDRNPG